VIAQTAYRGTRFDGSTYRGTRFGDDASTAAAPNFNLSGPTVLDLPTIVLLTSAGVLLLGLGLFTRSTKKKR
jgi:hypothetical protein